jgi:FkbM family methyltransferase
MHRNKELRLLSTSGLSWQGAAGYLKARWSISRWAVSRGVRPSSYIVGWKSGEQVALRAATSDVLVFREMFLERVYDQALAALGVERIRPRILDCGANVGFFPVLCSRLFTNPFVVCVEPELGNFDALKANIRGIPAVVKPVRAFLGAHPGQGYLKDCGSGEWAFTLSYTQVAAAEPIPVLDIPSLLQSAAWDDVDLLKVDIEGAEADVFASCSPWIRLVRFMIVETHPPYSINQLLADLSTSNTRWSVVHSATYGSQAVCALSRG